MHRRLALAVVVGSVLVLGVPALAGGSDQVPPAEAPAPIEILTKASTDVTRPVGVEDDVYCSGWLGGPDEKFPGSIVSAENYESQRMFNAGDVVYIDLGSNQGIVPGQEFWVVRPAHLVNRWGSNFEVIGRIYRTPARLRIVCTQENTSIAELTASCFETEIGDLILPFEPIPIPLARTSRMLTQCDPSSGKLSGRIVDVKNRAVPVGEDTIVFVDLGDVEGVAPGDFLTVFRARNDVATLRTILGEIAILATREHTSVAKVVRMRDTMYVGDQIELK